MAMNGTALKALANTTIYNKLNTLITPTLPPGTDLTQAQAGWQRIADAVSDAMLDIVTHIQTTAQVNSSVTVVSVSGVTTGPGVSGPGAGTATGVVL